MLRSNNGRRFGVSNVPYRRSKLLSCKSSLRVTEKYSYIYSKLDEAFLAEVERFHLNCTRVGLGRAQLKLVVHFYL